MVRHHCHFQIGGFTNLLTDTGISIQIYDVLRSEEGVFHVEVQLLTGRQLRQTNDRAFSVSMSKQDGLNKTCRSNGSSKRLGGEDMIGFA